MLGGVLAFPTTYAFVIESNDKLAFLLTMAITLIIRTFLVLIPASKRQLRSRGGYAFVTLGWLSAGLIGSFPYYSSGSVSSFTDACFESISGFTTTGASITTNIEGLSSSLLLWRSMTQWLGGMGIIVLSLAILPYLKIGGMDIF
jgi:trk/ktr system potassium uptake protein